jgi:hypothetical protein
LRHRVLHQERSREHSSGTPHGWVRRARSSLASSCGSSPRVAT